MCVTFSSADDPNADAAFKQWMKDNPQGFVFNQAGGFEMNVLHQLPCRSFQGNKPRATVKKICCNDLAEIMETISGLNWSYCGKSCPDKPQEREELPWSIRSGGRYSRS